MVFQLRGILRYVHTVGCCNNSVLRLGLLSCTTSGYHNVNCKSHTDPKKESRPLFNALKSIGTRKGNVQNVMDTSMTSKDYRVLYRFPYIRVGGIVNKLKKHLTVVTAAGVPTSALLKLMDFISIDTMTAFITLGGVSCCALYSVGIIFYKLVGALYLSSDSSTIKISYLDFWGKRVDIFCPVSDVVPFSEISERSGDIYINLRRYSTPQTLHFTLRFGTVLDTELFTDVFGNSNEF